MGQELEGHHSGPSCCRYESGCQACPVCGSHARDSGTVSSTVLTASLHGDLQLSFTTAPKEMAVAGCRAPHFTSESAEGLKSGGLAP